MKTKSQAVAADIAALLRARNPLIWIVTSEEARVEGYLFEAATSAGYVPRTWDVAQGVVEQDGVLTGMNDPGDVLTEIDKPANRRGVWIMRDLAPWISGPAGVTTLRQLRNLARSLSTTDLAGAQAIIVLSTSGDVPPEISSHATVIEWPLPDRAEIAQILDDALKPHANNEKITKPTDGERDAAIDAAVGLSGEEAAACYALSLIQLRRIDAGAVAKEKRRIVTRAGVLEWFDPLPGGLDSVGGLENLKAWLIARSSAYSPAARAYGLPAPKGAMLVGVPGCGKSLTAKAIATAWTVPLIKIDFGAMRSKFVGESEGNLRKAFRVIEAIGRCVVWADEIEKQLQGATSGSSDGGVSSDALGTFLSWMQDRAGEAFVIATANDVEGLPPELLRKGRFDEVWFIDLPTLPEREQILAASLRAHGRGHVKAGGIALDCDGFTGSEIAAIVPEALFAAFAEDAREVTALDLFRAAKTVVPLSKTAKEKISKLREWAATRARPATATSRDEPKAATSGRQLDLSAAD